MFLVCSLYCWLLLTMLLVLFLFYFLFFVFLSCPAWHFLTLHFGPSPCLGSFLLKLWKSNWNSWKHCLFFFYYYRFLFACVCAFYLLIVCFCLLLYNCQCLCLFLLVIFKQGGMLWLHFNHTGREFIMGSWVNNGSFWIQLTKENTLHQLPRLCCLRWHVRTVGNNMSSTWRMLNRAVLWQALHARAPMTWAILPLMFMLLSCKPPMEGERGWREGVKHEFIWQSFHLLINRKSLWCDSHVVIW